MLSFFKFLISLKEATATTTTTTTKKYQKTIKQKRNQTKTMTLF